MSSMLFLNGIKTEKGFIAWRITWFVKWIYDLFLRQVYSKLMPWNQPVQGATQRRAVLQQVQAVLHQVQAVLQQVQATLQRQTVLQRQAILQRQAVADLQHRLVRSSTTEVFRKLKYLAPLGKAVALQRVVDLWRIEKEVEWIHPTHKII